MTDAQLLQGRPLCRRDWAVMAALAVVCVLTRIPLWPELILHPDGAGMAWALERFDVAAERPHAPGYMLFWATGKLFFLLGASAESSLALTTTLYSALAVAALYALGVTMFGGAAGLAAAALLLFENNFWRVGLLHISAVMVALGGVVVALGCYRARQQPRSRWPLAAAVLLGLAVGYRQDLLLFLGPMWLWCAWGAGLRRVAGGLAILVCFNLLWTTLASWATGSYEVFREVGRLQWQEAVYPDSVFFAAQQGPGAVAEALIGNLATWFGLVFGEGSHLSVLAWLLLALYGVGRVLRMDWIARDRRAQLLLLWTVPAFCFHVLVHMFSRPHATVYGPPLMLLAGAGAVLMAADRAGVCPLGRGSRLWSRAEPRLGMILLLAAGLNVAVFLSTVVPEQRQSAASLQARLEYLRSLPPAETVLVQSDTLADSPNFGYYAREYELYVLQQTLARPRPSKALPSPQQLPEGTRWAVLLNPQARVANPSRRVEPLPGAAMRVVELTPHQRWMHFGPDGVRFSADPAAAETPSAPGG